MEFARIVLLAPHLHERFQVAEYALTRYEMLQIVVLVLEEVVFVVRDCLDLRDRVKGLSRWLDLTSSCV